MLWMQYTHDTPTRKSKFPYISFQADRHPENPPTTPHITSQAKNQARLDEAAGTTSPGIYRIQSRPILVSGPVRLTYLSLVSRLQHHINYKEINSIPIASLATIFLKVARRHG